VRGVRGRGGSTVRGTVSVSVAETDGSVGTVGAVGISMSTVVGTVG